MDIISIIDLHPVATTSLLSLKELYTQDQMPIFYEGISINYYKKLIEACDWYRNNYTLNKYELTRGFLCDEDFFTFWNDFNQISEEKMLAIVGCKINAMSLNFTYNFNNKPVYRICLTHSMEIPKGIVLLTSHEFFEREAAMVLWL